MLPVLEKLGSAHGVPPGSHPSPLASSPAAPAPAGRTGLGGEGALGLAAQQSPGAMFPLWDWVLPALLPPADQELLEVTGMALSPERPARARVTSKVGAGPRGLPSHEATGRSEQG